MHRGVVRGEHAAEAPSRLQSKQQQGAPTPVARQLLQGGWTLLFRGPPDSKQAPPSPGEAADGEIQPSPKRPCKVSWGCRREQSRGEPKPAFPPRPGIMAAGLARI